MGRYAKRGDMSAHFARSRMAIAGPSAPGRLCGRCGKLAKHDYVHSTTEGYVVGSAGVGES